MSDLTYLLTIDSNCISVDTLGWQLEILEPQMTITMGKGPIGTERGRMGQKAHV